MNDNLTTNASNEAESPAFLVGDVMRRFCSECEKPKVFCKGMCQACYSKMHRNTEKGKAQMIAYNLTKGKEAQRKFRERNKANKPPPKPHKANCELCSENKAVSKNLCMTCYHRLYQRKKNGWKEAKPKKSATPLVKRGRYKINIDVMYKNVLAEVKKGFTILNACKISGFKSSSNLYRLISPLQKAELNVYKRIGVVDKRIGVVEDDF